MPYARARARMCVCVCVCVCVCERTIDSAKECQLSSHELLRDPCSLNVGQAEETVCSVWPRCPFAEVGAPRQHHAAVQRQGQGARAGELEETRRSRAAASSIQHAHRTAAEASKLAKCAYKTWACALPSRTLYALRSNIVLALISASEGLPLLLLAFFLLFLASTSFMKHCIASVRGSGGVGLAGHDKAGRNRHRRAAC